MKKESAIKINQLYKAYNQGTEKESVAVRNIDLEVPRGSFFGLLGPNGAGKSTMINIIAGIVNKTSGNISICGFDIDKDPMQAKRMIGVVPQELLFDPFFSVWEALEYQAGYYGVPKNKRRTAEIIEALGLTDKTHTNARGLSGGMKRRLLVAKAMVHNPEVIILDEPTAGVDVELRTQLWKYIKSLNDKGTTILLTTHYLEEAESLCDNIAIINKGRIIANDSKKNIMGTIDQKVLFITTAEEVREIPKELAKFDVSKSGNNQLAINYKRSEVSIDEILAAISKTKITVKDLSTDEPDLEDIFRHLTAKDFAA